MVCDNLNGEEHPWQHPRSRTSKTFTTLLAFWRSTQNGEMLELRYGVRGIPSVGRLLRRSQVLSLGEVYDLLDDAVEHGVLSEEERDKIAEADLIVRGKDRKTGTDVYLVIEVSWGVGPS